jgi:hypothetical protein
MLGLLITLNDSNMYSIFQILDGVDKQCCLPRSWA